MRRIKCRQSSGSQVCFVTSVHETRCLLEQALGGTLLQGRLLNGTLWGCPRGLLRLLIGCAGIGRQAYQSKSCQWLVTAAPRCHVASVSRPTCLTYQAENKFHSLSEDASSGL